MTTAEEREAARERRGNPKGLITGRRRVLLQALHDAGGSLYSADMVEQCDDISHDNVHSCLGAMRLRGWVEPLDKRGSSFRRYRITLLGRFALSFSDAETEYFNGRPRK